MQLLESWRRLDSELFDERAPSILVGLESLCLPAGAVEREHELSTWCLPERMLAHDRLELTHEARGSA
jgi:hypothetical protein